jgi:formate dehydrogenase major subunit
MENQMINLTIDGVGVSVKKGTTILEAAKNAGIEIPNLCYLKDIGAYGACGVCVVEVKGSPKLLRACSSVAQDGMEVLTTSPRALSTRKIALDLMMSDHDGDCIGPCKLNCPAKTDCQKYVKEIAEGRFADAVSTVMETFPLPASIGRVCPHPCESKCRRSLVEEPISIAFLKSFAADTVRKEGNFNKIAIAPSTGKKVGIIGGGPAGLTAAFRLAKLGHSVTIYDQMPQMGGMLRYGIPEYRLPKDVLDFEISAIEQLGITLVNNFKIGKDASLDNLATWFDAVIIATGAWKASPMNVNGESLKGVFGGIDFLRSVQLGEKPEIGEKVAIVGGGNTAMDACRTAVRLGAKEVYIVYRRTKAEMPAEEIEISEAEEEGVKFKFLRAPVEIQGENGAVKSLRLQVMALGEPDSKGRRRPVPVEGEEEILELDSVISAIGQKNDNFGLNAVDKTERGTIKANCSSFATNIPKVFACGDCTNSGAGVAIEAIAEANEAALAVDALLNGYEYKKQDIVISEREVTSDDFSDKEKVQRTRMPHRTGDVRKNDFKEVNLGFSKEDAQREAKRCLECGCHDFSECKLIKYANQCKSDAKKFAGEHHPGFIEKKLKSIERNQRKCILCNLCVRTCQEKAGKGILGLVGRGFTTIIKPEFNSDERIEGCRQCHLCVDNCPTGALRIVD